MSLLSTRAHGVLDYARGVGSLGGTLLVRDRRAARMLGTAGAGTLVASALTDYEAGVVRAVPTRVHLLAEAASGALLVAGALSLRRKGARFSDWAPLALTGLAQIAGAALTKRQPGDRRVKQSAPAWTPPAPKVAEPVVEVAEPEVAAVEVEPVEVEPEPVAVEPEPFVPEPVAFVPEPVASCPSPSRWPSCPSPSRWRPRPSPSRWPSRPSPTRSHPRPPAPEPERWPPARVVVPEPVVQEPVVHEPVAPQPVAPEPVAPEPVVHLAPPAPEPVAATPPAEPFIQPAPHTFAAQQESTAASGHAPIGEAAPSVDQPAVHEDPARRLIVERGPHVWPRPY